MIIWKITNPGCSRWAGYVLTTDHDPPEGLVVSLVARLGAVVPITAEQARELLLHHAMSETFLAHWEG